MLFAFLLFGHEISQGGVPCSSSQLPEELALWLIVGLRVSEMLQEEDKVSFERCLCGALGVGIEVRSQN
ncbi:hypothetical protein ACFX2B_040869 [Malus domestica]